MNIKWWSLLLFFAPWVVTSAEPRWLAEDDQTLHFRFGIADPALDLTVKTPGQDATFTTNTPGGLFFDFAYKSLAIGFRLPPTDNEKEISKFGKSRATDFQFRIFGHRTSPEFIYQKFKGYYPEKYIDGNGDQIIRPDMASEVYAVNIVQSLSPNFFSQVIAFDQRGTQVKKGGSLLLFVSLTKLTVRGDEAIFPLASQGLAGQLGSVQHYDSTSLIAGGGYGWSVPFLSRMTFSGAFMAGLGQHLYGLDLGSSTDSGSGPARRFGVRLDVGYNYEKYFSGLQLLVDSNSAIVLDSQLENSTLVARIYLGYRFGPITSETLDVIDSSLAPLRF